MAKVIVENAEVRVTVEKVKNRRVWLSRLSSGDFFSYKNDVYMVVSNTGETALIKCVETFVLSSLSNDIEVNLLDLVSVTFREIPE